LISSSATVVITKSMNIGASKKEEVFLKKLEVFHFQAMYQRLLHVYTTTEAPERPSR
jgi:hypothetical protein